MGFMVVVVPAILGLVVWTKTERMWEGRDEARTTKHGPNPIYGDYYTPDGHRLRLYSNFLAIQTHRSDTSTVTDKKPEYGQ